LLSSVITNALLLASCDLLDLSGGLNKGSLGLFQWNDPSNEKDECFDFPPDEDREIEDKALKCAQVCAVIAICFGGVVFVFGFFKQCIIPLPCSQRIMDLSSTCVQIFLGLVYVVWASKACDFYKCSYGGEGATLLIVTQFLWLGAGLFSRCMRDGRFERRDEIKAQKELKKEEKARKAAEAEVKKKEEAEAASAKSAKDELKKKEEAEAAAAKDELKKKEEAEAAAAEAAKAAEEGAAGEGAAREGAAEEEGAPAKP
jgi:hypothetical protein